MAWTKSKHWPTNKWWAATVAGAGTLATAIITDGLHRATCVVAVGLLVQRIVAWITPDSSLGDVTVNVTPPGT